MAPARDRGLAEHYWRNSRLLHLLADIHIEPIHVERVRRIAVVGHRGMRRRKGVGVVGLNATRVRRITVIGVYGEKQVCLGNVCEFRFVSPARHKYRHGACKSLRRPDDRKPTCRAALRYPETRSFSSNPLRPTVPISQPPCPASSTMRSPASAPAAPRFPNGGSIRRGEPGPAFRGGGVRTLASTSRAAEQKGPLSRCFSVWP